MQLSQKMKTKTKIETQSKTMRAMFIRDYVENLNDLQPSVVPAPQFPPPGARTTLLLVRICYTSPTHVDTLYARGLHQNNHSKLVHPPFILGTEFAGYVENIHIPEHTGNVSTPRPSSTMTEFRVGDRVWGAALGSFAPWIIVPATAIQHIPEGFSLIDAAGLGASTAPVSYGALVRLAALKKGETCLIHAAAGGLGVAAVMIARALGANVIGTVGSHEKQQVIQDLLLDGASGTIPVGNGVVRYDTEGWEKEVTSLTGQKKGVDVVFDTVGLVEKSVRCCAFEARIVIVGFVGRGDGKNGVMERVAMNRVLLKGVKLLGYRFGETARRNPHEAIKLWQGFNELVSAKTFKPVIYRHYQGLRCVPEALQDLASRKVYGKVVVEIESADHDPDEESSAASSKISSLPLDSAKL